MSRVRNSSKRAGKILDQEEKIDDLERRLKEKVEISSGFSDPIAQSRLMEQSMKFFDSEKNGYLTFPQFFAALTKFNFVGVQREIECLFNRYDEYATGSIDYKDLAKHFWGIGRGVKLDPVAKEIVARIRARIVSLGGADGYQGLVRAVSRLDGSESGRIDREDLLQVFMDYGVYDVSPEEFGFLFEFFDVNADGIVAADELLRIIRDVMSFDRKLVVLDAFRRLDRSGNDTVPIEQLLQSYDPSTHPSVNEGRISAEQAVQFMLNGFKDAHNLNGKVYWAEFLDYYKGIGLAVDEDETFELLVRNAWRNGASEGLSSTSRRVVVVHADGSQDVVELFDDYTGEKFDSETIIRRLAEQGIRDVVEVRL